MDEIDRAQDEVERSLAESLRSRRSAGPAPTGRCLWCDEILDDVKRWCSPECRDQWDARKR